MNKTLTSCVSVVCFVAAHAVLAAPVVAERGSAAEAEAMANRAVALIKSAGPESAYRTFTEASNKSFKDRDLYVWVYDFNGNCLAHGGVAKMVGKNLIGLKDFDGKEVIKDQIDLVKTKGSGWYGPFKFPNPVNRKVEEKKAFCARGAGDTMVCSGIYSAT